MKNTTLNVRILRLDGSVNRSTESASGSTTANVAVRIGSRLRRIDPRIAAMRVDGFDGYTWMGHYTAAHNEAARAAYAANPNWQIITRARRNPGGKEDEMEDDARLIDDYDANATYVPSMWNWL